MKIKSLKKQISRLLVAAMLLSVLSILPAFDITLPTFAAPAGTGVNSIASIPNEGGTYYLTSNITIDGSSYTLRDVSNLVLDGNGKTITFQNGAHSLFANCTNTTIKNVTFASASEITIETDTYNSISPICAGIMYGNTTLENITSNVSYNAVNMVDGTDDSHAYLAGVVSAVHATGENQKIELTDITWNGSLTQGILASQNKLAGIVGGVILEKNTSTATLTNLTTAATASISTTMHTTEFGGVVGVARGNGAVTFNNCTNNAALSCIGTGGTDHFGGICGNVWGDKYYFNNCTNNGKMFIQSTNQYFGPMGGILGQSSSTYHVEIIDCKNTGEFEIKRSVSRDVGGIVGWIGNFSGGVKLERCENTGKISFPSFSGLDAYVAGVLGEVARKSSSDTDATSIEIIDCINRGEVLCGGTVENAMGGVVGSASWGVDGIMKGCQNFGAITAKNIEGIMGGCIASIGNGYNEATANIDFLVENCENFGKLSVTDATDVNTNNSNVVIGGVVGRVRDNNDSKGSSEINNIRVYSCRNTGELVNKGYVNGVHLGGIVGGFVAAAYIDIRHCINEGNITNEGNGWTGTSGILGSIWTISNGMGWSGQDFADIRIIDCHNLGNMDASIAGLAAGIVTATHQMFEDTVVTISGCTNSGSIKGRYEVGGIVASTGKDNGTVIDNTSSATIEESGWYMTWIVKDCINSGAVTGQAAAGIFGRVNEGNHADKRANSSSVAAVTIENCSNSAAITGSENGGALTMAGILTQVYSVNAVVKNCSNTGAVTRNDTTNASHGTAGICKTSSLITVESSYYSAAGAGNLADQMGEQDDSNASSRLTTNTANAYTYGRYVGTVLRAEVNKGTYGNDTTTAHLIFDGRQFASATASGTDGGDIVLIRDLTISDGATRKLNGGSFSAKAYRYVNDTSKGEVELRQHNISFSGAGAHVFSHIVGPTGDDTLEFRDLNITGSSSGATVSVAPFGSVSATGNLLFENIQSSLAITANPTTAGTHLSGVVGNITNGNTTIRSVAFTGSISCNASKDDDEAGGARGHIGGIVANVEGTTLIEDCTNSGSVTVGGRNSDVAHYGVGGILGTAKGPTTLAGLTNSGTITCADWGRGIEQIVGEDNKDGDKFSVCTGGVAGHIKLNANGDVISIDDCHNNGVVDAEMGAGVICGICYDAGNAALNTMDANLVVTAPAFASSSVSITNCTNTASVTGERMAAGIIGDTTRRFSYKIENADNNAIYALVVNTEVEACTNSGNIHITGVQADYKKNESDSGSNLLYAGGIAGAGNYMHLLDCVNSGRVEGRYGVGGIIGAKPEGVVEPLIVEQCVNNGQVASVTYAGGIIGYVDYGRFEVVKCVNNGAVQATNTAAGGILGALDGGIFWATSESDSYAHTYDRIVTELGMGGLVEGCVNAGSISITTGAARYADAWSQACGIVGTYLAGIEIKDCVHVGTLATATQNNPSFGTFPIANSIELTISADRFYYSGGNGRPNASERGIVVFSGNIYAEGSAMQDASYYHYSTVADPATIEALVREIDVYAFDKDVCADEIEVYDNLSAKNFATVPYTAEELQSLQNAYAQVENSLNTNASVAKVKQSTYYDLEDLIRDAIYNYTDNSAYVINIPEQVSTSGAFEIQIQVNNFTEFSALDVKITSANDFKLISTLGNEIYYSFIDDNDNEYVDGQIVTATDDILADESLGNGKSGTLIYRVHTRLEAHNVPNGAYRDTISVNVAYNTGKKTA